MQKLSQIIKVLESNAPLTLAEEWDNCGLIVGDSDAMIAKALVCVDVTPAVVEEAVKNGCNLIVSHHPVIFGAIKRIGQDDLTGKIIMQAVKNDVNIYCMHTNLDCVTGGINSKLAVELGLIDRDGKDCCWRTGKLNKPTSLRELVDKIVAITGEKHVRTAGDLDANIDVVGICSGAGGRMDELIDEVLVPHGVQVFITAEVKHSLLLTLKDKAISLIELGHWTSERIAKNIIYDWLQGSIEVEKSQRDADPYN